MPNPIKYITGTESDALVKGNFRIGTGSVGKGPSDTTGYYQGPNVPSGGYVIYMNKDGAPGNLSYHSAANDAQLISFTNSLAGQSYTTVQQCFDYYYGQTDKVLVNQDYPADYPYIVMDGLVLNLDAGITQSYPGSGTVWTDVNGLGPKNNGTLTNGPTFSTDGGGSIVFDGSDDRVSRTSSVNTGNNFTVSSWIYPTLLGTTRRAVVGNGYPYSGRIGWLFCTAGAGVNNTFFVSIGSDISYRVATANCLSINTWQYITGVVTNGGQTIDLYKNGENVNGTQFVLLSSGTITYSDNEFNIGFRDKDKSQSFDPFTGNIANVQIYNRALSSQEILQNYNATKGRFGL